MATTCLQNESESGVSRSVHHGSGKPMLLLKNWRSRSTSVTSATGAFATLHAMRARRSNGSSGGESSRRVAWSTASRFRFCTISSSSFAI